MHLSCIPKVLRCFISSISLNLEVYLRASTRAWSIATSPEDFFGIRRNARTSTHANWPFCQPRTNCCPGGFRAAFWEPSKDLWFAVDELVHFLEFLRHKPRLNSWFCAIGLLYMICFFIMASIIRGTTAFGSLLFPRRLARLLALLLSSRRVVGSSAVGAEMPRSTTRKIATGGRLVALTRASFYALRRGEIQSHCPATIPDDAAIFEWGVDAPLCLKIDPL